MAIFPALGRVPSGEFEVRTHSSPHFGKKGFENIHPTTLMVNSGAYWRSIRHSLPKPANSAPEEPLPSVKTDLLDRIDGTPVINWMGHSGYLIRGYGYNILVDPVMSGHASPFKFAIRAFKGADIYTVNDLPDIDLLIITHDHYDHLDYETIGALAPRVKKICTSLGVGSHLRFWGIDASIITELDWHENAVMFPGIEIGATPARHFSGRTLNRNKTLWSSFVLQLKSERIFVGGDSGYDDQFADIGARHGPFDLAILETGQYNEDWPLIHMMPEDAVKAACDLKANLMLPVHWGKFALAFHPWYEPADRVLAAAPALGQAVAFPLIGESLVLGSSYPVQPWWRHLK